MCSYREKKAEPQELLQLDGYTVDYTDPQPGTGPTARGRWGLPRCQRLPNGSPLALPLLAAEL